MTANEPSKRRLLGLTLGSVLGTVIGLAVLKSCGGGAVEIAEPIPHAGVHLTPFTSGGIDLPAVGGGLLEGNDWFLKSAGEWVQMRGRVGHLDVWSGQPGDRELALRLKRVGFLPEDVDVEVFLNGTSVATGTVGRSASWLRTDVPGNLIRPGHNRVRVESSADGRPVDLVEGNGDTRRLSLLLSDVEFGAAGGAELGGELPLDLAPGQGLGLRLAPTEQSELTVRASGQGTLWIGLRDVTTGETLDWSDTPLSGPEEPIELDLEALAGRMLEISLAADSEGAPVRIEGLDASTRPAVDVLLIVVDTLRADLFAGENMPAGLPAFERLRSDGVVFDRAFSHAPMTLPSHTALFSSRNPSMSGVTNNWQTIPTELPLIADWMSSAGFETRASISLGTLWTPMPGGGLERGFDQYLSTEDMLRGPAVNERTMPLLADLDPDRPSFLFAHYCDPHEPYNSAAVGPRYCSLATPDGRDLKLQLNQWTKTDVPVDFGSDGRVVLESEHEFKLRRLWAWDGTKRLPVSYVEGGEGKVGKRFEAQVDARGSGRLELWVHDKPKTRDEAIARYAEEIVYADGFVGQLLESLDADGRYDDTLIVFTSDHGEQLFEHGHFGHARHLYDAEIHVPLVIKPPAHMADALEPLRAAAEGVVRHVDVVPTILDLLDLPPLPGMIGRSLLEEADRLHLSETYRPESPKDLLAFRDERFKLIHAPEAGTYELYDLEADPLEQNDLWESQGDEFVQWAGDLALYASGKGPSMDPADLDDATRQKLIDLGYLDPDAGGE